MSLQRRRSLLWFSYYVCAFAIAFLVLWSARTEAHGDGCCNDPCIIYPVCECQYVCDNYYGFQYSYPNPACEPGECFVSICFWYTRNVPTGPCEFLCCNDDTSNCA